jgi:DNA-binding CsgD family transcriptional regulator
MNSESKIGLFATAHETEVFKKLTTQEKNIMKLCASGKSYSGIQSILKITNKTVQFHVSNILKKFDYGSVKDIVRIWTQLGHTESPEFKDGDGI